MKVVESKRVIESSVCGDLPMIATTTAERSGDLNNQARKAPITNTAKSAVEPSAGPMLLGEFFSNLLHATEVCQAMQPQS